MSENSKRISRNMAEKIKQIEAAKHIAMGSAVERYISYVTNEYNNLLREAGTKFYEDYTPVDGGYKRTGSVVNGVTASLVRKDVGNGKYKLVGSVDDSGLTRTRSGGPLDELILDEGWHGGAAHISADKESTWGTHPNPGTPYWRTPIGIYSRWGRMAERMTPSPWEYFTSEAASRLESRYVVKFGEILDASIGEAMRHFS